MKNKSLLQFRLIVMNFLEFAVWGAYLTSMGTYLFKQGMGQHIGWFYSIQGIVSLFMPALMGIVADRWIQAQKTLSLCHALAGIFMCAAGLYAYTAADVQFATLFSLYTISVAFFMPTIALTNSVAFNALVKADMDTVKDFPPIRVFVFIFSMMLGMCLQVTNSYANPFITSFGAIEEFANTFGVQHANILISISQICEALCILAIPFFLKRFGIKNVMLMAMFAWVFRFGFFGAGNPGMPGVILFILSCIVYGFAFDFFNISGALYVDQETEEAQRSSAQGLFMMMTNGSWLFGMDGKKHGTFSQASHYS